VELLQLAAVPPDPFELGPQGIEEERADELQDVLFPRVMRPEVAAQRRVHDRLEEGAEDRRADPAPVEAAAVQKRLAHGGVEGGGGKRLFEKSAVHVGEGREVFVEGCEPPVVRGIQNMEEGRKAIPEVRAVLCSLSLDEFPELLLFADTRVFGEEAEEEPDKIDLERVPLVAVLPVDPFHFLFEGRDAAAGDAENVEKPVPERLPLRILGRLVRILPRKHEGAGPDLVPAQRHRQSPRSFLCDGDIGPHSHTP
jgi:hypothetical protein